MEQEYEKDAITGKVYLVKSMKEETDVNSLKASQKYIQETADERIKEIQAEIDKIEAL